MAQEKITIKFIPDGNVALVKAIKELNKATRQLNGQLNNLNKSNVAVAKSQTLVQQRVGAATKAANASSTAFTKLQATISVYRNKVLLASFATGLLIRPLINLVKLSADFKDLERGFEQLGKGIESSSEFLDKLREATNGTVDDMVLMEQANNAMMLGVVKSEDEMAQLFDTAQRLGQALGKDTVHSIESMVTGMGRQSRLMLDNIGIITDAGTANKRFAEEQGLLASSLTDSQRKTAFNNEVLRKSSEIMEKLGIEVLNTNQHIAAMQVATARLGREFGQVLEPVLIVISKTLVFLANNIDANLVKAFTSAVFIVGAFALALKGLNSQIVINLGFLMLQHGALKGFTVATGLAIKSTKKFTLALMKNPLFLKATLLVAGVLAVTAVLKKYFDSTKDVEQATKDFMDTTVEADNVNKDFKKSIKDNVNALQQELDLLNADNDLHKMAIRLKRDLTLENHGLHDSEIELFNQIQERKKELEEIKKQEKEEIARKKKIQDIVKEAAMFGKDATLIALQDKQSIIAAEIEHAKAIVARTNVEGVSTEESAKMQEQIEILEGTHKSIGDEIDRHREKNRELTDEEKFNAEALKRSEDAMNNTKEAQRDLLQSQIDYLETLDSTNPANEKAIAGIAELQAELDELNKQFKITGDAAVKDFQDKVTMEGFDKIAESMNSMGGSMDMMGIVDQFFETKELFETEADGLRVAFREAFSSAGAEAMNFFQTISQERIKTLQEQGRAELESLKGSRRFQKMSESQKKQAEQDILKETNAAILKEFETQKDMNRISVIMETSRAIMEAAPRPGLIALVAAMGAMQLATINAQKPPKMAQGGLIGGRRHSQGGTLIEAEQGEFVMSRNAVDAIGVENLNRMNMGGASGVNVSFSGNIMSDDFIENEAIPKIREAVRRGSDIGVS